MDIKRAKQEIEHTIQAYLSKDEYGEYQIPAIRQRPVLLMGPPGIGKTQIMEQIAKDLRIGLVAYTITHLLFHPHHFFKSIFFRITQFSLLLIVLANSFHRRKKG